MRIRIIIAAALVAASAAFPAHSVAAGPLDFVVGAAKDIWPSGPWSVSVRAHSGPHGESPKGSFSFFIAGQLGPGRADVICLSVDGTDAKVVGKLRTPLVSPFDEKTYTHVTVFVHDEGGPRSRSPLRDRFDFAGFGYSGSVVFDQATCALLTELPPGTPAFSTDGGTATHGNLIVHDAP